MHSHIYIFRHKLGNTYRRTHFTTLTNKTVILRLTVQCSLKMWMAYL